MCWGEHADSTLTHTCRKVHSNAHNCLLPRLADIASPLELVDVVKLARELWRKQSRQVGRQVGAEREGERETNVLILSELMGKIEN